MDAPSVSLDSESLHSTLKRKRSSSPNANTQSHDINLASQVYLDIFDALRSFDKLLTVLNHPINPTTDSKDTDAPSTKRVKLTQVDTIAARLQSGYYTDRVFDDVLKDIKHVVAAIVDPINATLPRQDRNQPPAHDLNTLRRVQAFALQATNLLRRKLLAKTSSQDKLLKVDPRSASAIMSSNQPAARTVLTLFGNAPTPKQLFSSLQHPKDSTQPSSDHIDLDLEQLGLPNMLNATKVLPLTPDAALGSRPRQPTFAHVFPPPASLPPLNPPKSKSTTRSASISWITKDTALPKPSRKNAYTMQPLIVGSWLDYGARDADRESSGAIKRRRRESIVNSAPLPKPVEEMSPEEILAQEQALFKSAYSSFAPPTDNSKAIVPNEVRDRVWWHKVGHERFDKRFVLDPALEDSFPLSIDSEEAIDDEPATLGGNDEMKAFEEAVRNFDEDAFNADHLVIDIDDQERTTEQMLMDISALIETLSSYQRIRNSTIASAPSSRNPTSPSPAMAALIGTPTEPTKEETTVYKALRSQLAQMISKLPPYAVAKLDGEQLEDLIISRTITVAGKEYRGTMEEDQLTRMIKSSAAVQAAAGSTSTARPSNSSSSYSRPASLAQPPRSAQAPNPSSYYGARTPATSFNRSTVAPQGYSTPTATASQRQAYSAASGYPATAPRPSSYSQQPNGQPPGYRSGYNYGSTFNPQPPTPQQSAQTPSVQQQTQYRNAPTHAQTPAAGAGAYTPRPAPYGVTVPQYSTQQQQQQQQRTNGQQAPAQAAPMQPTSGRATPTQSQMQSQSQPQTSSVSAGAHANMMTDRQRQMAQLPQQPVARAVGQSEVGGGGSPAVGAGGASAPIAAPAAPVVPTPVSAPVSAPVAASAAAPAPVAPVASITPVPGTASGVQSQGQQIPQQGQQNGQQDGQQNGEGNAAATGSS